MSFSISERDSICSIPRRPSSVASPPPEAPKPSLFQKRRGSLHSGSPPRPTPGLVVPSAWPSSPAHGTSVLLGGLRWFNRPPRERREDALPGRPPCSLSRCVCTDFPRCRLIGGGLFNSHECVRPSPLSHFLLEKAHRPLRTGTPRRDVHLSLDSGPFMLPHIPPNLCTVLAFANSATISAALCIICRKFRV